jgi:hypothetical protein
MTYFRMSEHVPALHKISEDSFKDTLLEYLKDDPYVLVFAEHTVSLILSNWRRQFIRVF